MRIDRFSPDIVDPETVGLIERLSNWDHGHKTMIVSETIDALTRLSQRAENWKARASQPATPPDSVAQLERASEPDEGRRDAGSSPAAVARCSADTITPDFDTAAFALGFRKFENGKWYSPTPSVSMNTAGTWETAEQIFEWWGRANGAAQPAQQLQEAVAAAHAAFEAIPIGYPLQQNGRTIDHTLLNEAKRLCEQAMMLSSTDGEYDDSVTAQDVKGILAQPSPQSKSGA